MSQNVPSSIVIWELFLMKTKSLWGHSCAFYDVLAASNQAAKKWALSLKYHLIKSLEEWVDDSQRAFPKAVSGCLLYFPSVVLSRSPWFSLFFLMFLVYFVSVETSGMKHMNRTLLLPLLSRCQQILEDTGVDIAGEQINVTASNSTASPLPSPAYTTTTTTTTTTTSSSSRETYDNAYFYILIVMFFYSFLAMTLFKCLGSDEDKKDPYEEFISGGQPSTQKFNTGHMEEKFDFEEESSLWATGFSEEKGGRVWTHEGRCFDSHQARKTSVLTTQARPASDFGENLL